MGCRSRESSQDDDSVSLGEALLFTTMCIVGLPVEVHVKDGSVYSGIFHTACLEKGYGIVLKKAMMTKKGKHNANVAHGGLIETLVVLSGDLVQVVAKGVLYPADGAGNIAGNDLEAVEGTVPSFEFVESEEKNTNAGLLDVDEKRINYVRSSVQNFNGFANAITPTKFEDNLLTRVEKDVGYMGNDLEEKGKSDGVNLSQVGDGKSQGKLGDYKQHFEIRKEKTTCELRGSSLISDACLLEEKSVDIHEKMASKVLAEEASCDDTAASLAQPDNQDCKRHTPAEILPSDAVSAGVMNSSSTVVDVALESCLNLPTTSSEMVPSQSSDSHRSTKEFKLNPGAKVFSPSFSNPRSAMNPALSTVASMAYLPNNPSPVPVAAAQTEIEITPFVPRSSPHFKFVPYGNLMAGNGGSSSQYSQTLVGHLGSRTQPVRYAGQHHPLQAGTTYVHPNPQAVVVGRLGQIVYLHPVSQGAATISPVSARPLLTPYPVQFPKHQGNAAAQAMQLCVPPPMITGGQQPIALPNHAPLLQPPFPANRSIPVPGSNSLFSTKFP
ncbi:polyadenylate-binding protein-interacting protein 4 isoform X2 [Malania oleifera]|uniref:polyadenylate-binding protein-interacting protein 4 isoform X2 n=1 Tax=Malania oleifera TaxID=397392 RepID=UPI0025AEBD7E|nr:polyadenylate-binding protein-interacting protein 4 isoform X2 [Malania oleifera]